MKEQQVIREITTDSSRYFYGHGTYSSDGHLLFCTESNLQSFDGIIAVRDSKSMDYVGEFPSYGKEPHECKLIDNGNIMVVTNGGGPMNGSPPSITYIDVHSKQLLEKVNLTNPRINTGHMALAQDGSLVVASAPRSGLSKNDLGGVSIKTAGGPLQSISAPADITSKIRGEALSVIILESKHIAAITHPGANMVTFWSTISRQLLHMIELPHPRGVTLTTDEKFFIISYDTTGKLIKVDTETLELNKASAISDTYISGSHIYNWSRGLTEILAPGPLI